MEQVLKSPKMVRAGNKAHLSRFNNLLQAKDEGAITEIIHLSNDIKRREYDWEYECSEDDLICKGIGPTTWESFCRHGDRNRATERMILKWIRNNVEPLDVQTMWISEETGREVTPTQLAEFIISHDGGCSDYYYHRQTMELKTIFKECTGFNWS